MFDNIPFVPLLAIILCMVVFVFMCGEKEKKAKPSILSPQDPEATNSKIKKTAMEIGNHLFSEGRFLDAIKSYKEALRGAPKNVSMYIRIGQCYQNLGNYAEAEAIYKKGLEAAPEAYDCWLELGRVCFKQGNLKLALTAVERYMSACPGQNEARKLKARILMEQRDYDEAAELYKELVKSEPDNMQYQSTLAEICIKLGSLEEALKHYQAIIAIDPKDDKNIKYRMMELHQQNNHYDAAIELLRNILSTNSGTMNPSTDIHNELARCLEKKAQEYMQSEQYDSASQYYEEAMRHNAALYSIHCGLGLAYGHSRRYLKAIECFKRAIEMKPAVADPYHQMVAMYEKLQQFNEAIDCVNALQKIVPSAQGLYKLGRLYMLKGDQYTSVNYFNMAIEEDPALADAYYNLGLVLEKQRKPREALKLFKKTIDIDSTHGEARKQYETIKQRLNIR